MARKINPLARFREDRLAKREEARKKRERERRRALLICGGVLVVLTPVIIVGAVTENRNAAESAAASATQVPSVTQPPSPAAPTTSQPPPAPEPSATEEDADDGDYEPDEVDETHLKFGQTAHLTSTAGDSNTPLEFTVSAPKAFKPSKNATLYDAKSSVLTKGKRQPTNVYFVVTVKNTSKDEAWDANSVFSDVTGTGDDEVVSEVSDGDVEGTVDLQDGDNYLRPGKSSSVKDGFSVKSADSIQYELSVDGLAGTTYYFTR